MSFDGGNLETYFENVDLLISTEDAARLKKYLSWEDPPLDWFLTKKTNAYMQINNIWNPDEGENSQNIRIIDSNVKYKSTLIPNFLFKYLVKDLSCLVPNIRNPVFIIFNRL